jgi:phospholipid/cholesterol/gamma-HCH transport system permease protein
LTKRQRIEGLFAESEVRTMAAWEFRRRGETGVIAVLGDWLVKAGGAGIPRISRLSGPAGLRRLAFDVSGLGRWDMTLVAFLWDVKQLAAASHIIVDDSELPPTAQKLLGLLPARPKERPVVRRRRVRPLAWISGRAASFLSGLGGSAMLAIAMAGGTLKLLAGRAHVRGADFIRDLNDAGPRALVIVGVVNLLVGAIIAFIGAAQLRQFSAQAYVPNLVGVTCVRELASVITGIVMAGRTGGAYAARLATMRGSDEIAALSSLGIPVDQYLVLPSVVSLCTTMPVLYLVASFMAIAGGLAVATLSLDFTGAGYLYETFQAVPLGDFVIGAVKSLAFAALIGITSCRIGLNAARSAQAVGNAATSAVVLNIVGIIALDAMFAVVLARLGI